MMQAAIRFGEPDLSWQQYELAEYPVVFNSDASTYKAIVRKNKLVAILGQGYQLLPNEEALKVATEAGELAGFQRFKKPIYNRRETRMHAWFIDPENGPYPVDGEKVYVGVSIRNAIDGTSAFSTGAFTYRTICKNGVILGYRQLKGFINRMHTKGLQDTIQNLKSRMILAMDQARSIITRYEQMAEQEVTEQLIKAIKKSRVPKKVLPAYLEEPKAEIPGVTQWQLYNDITEAIWHNAEAGIKTKTFQLQTLHKALPVM